MKIGLPQLIWFCLVVMGWGVFWYNHDTPQPVQSVTGRFLMSLVLVGLVYWGGFFDLAEARHYIPQLIWLGILTFDFTRDVLRYPKTDNYNVWVGTLFAIINIFLLAWGGFFG